MPRKAKPKPVTRAEFMRVTTRYARALTCLDRAMERTDKWVQRESSHELDEALARLFNLADRLFPFAPPEPKP